MNRDHEIRIRKIISVVDHPNADRLNLNLIDPDYEVISNKLEDGSPRYKVGQLIVYVPISSFVPDYILMDGYWDSEKNKGILGGETGNIVEHRKIRGIVSNGLILPIVTINSYGDIILKGRKTFSKLPPEYFYQRSLEGDDVGSFLGIKKVENE